MMDVGKPLMWSTVFHKEMSWDSTTGFRIWQFPNQALKQYLQMHLLAERFGGDDRGFSLKEGVHRI